MFHVLYCTHADYISLFSGGSPNNVVAKRAAFLCSTFLRNVSDTLGFGCLYSYASFNSVFAPQRGIFLGFLGMVNFSLKILLSQP